MWLKKDGKVVCPSRDQFDARRAVIKVGLGDQRSDSLKLVGRDDIRQRAILATISPTQCIVVYHTR